MTNSTTASPAKLKNGSWGARVQGSVSVGDTITITTRAGKSWDARVTKVVWSGEGVAVCATESLDRPARSGSTSRSYGRGRWTGCSCGSREDHHGDLIDARNNCASCEHDR